VSEGLAVSLCGSRSGNRTLLRIAAIRGFNRLSPAKAGVLLGLILFPAGALAQSTLGTIMGTVTDASGAVVPKATIKAINTDENTSRTALANANGDYEFVNTKPGRYKVEVSAAGFQDFHQSHGRRFRRVDWGALGLVPADL